jgi:hypothetical protein
MRGVPLLYHSVPPGSITSFVAAPALLVVRLIHTKVRPFAALQRVFNREYGEAVPSVN